MTEVTQYPIDDTEYTTPAQAAEIRRMKAELPLWADMSIPEVENVDVAPHANDCFSTIDAAQVQTDVESPADVSSGFSADNMTLGDGSNTLAQWMVDMDIERIDLEANIYRQIDAEDIAAHRALNGTTGMESEE